MASAVALAAVNFAAGYRAQANWQSFRRNVWKFKTNVMGLLLLEAAAGLAATWIVVALGLTKPEWLDEPLGWLLLGTVGPAIAGASIASFKVGGANINLGLSLFYTPVRRMLMRAVDDAFWGAEWRYRQSNESAFRQLALERHEAGEISLKDFTDAMRLYRDREFRDLDEKKAIDQFLSFIEQTNMPPRDQIGQTVAFLVEHHFEQILKEVVGEPPKPPEAAKPPDEAATGPSPPGESG